MVLAFFHPKPKPTDPNRRGEVRLGSVHFTVHKLNNRPRPTKTDRVKIISCFAEFGCEVIGCLYCIPRLLRRYPGQYVVAMGWHGREYLYRHLVDEFWELDEEFMWLRDHARAFHHVSDNLERLERAATVHGDVVPSSALGHYAVSNACRTCGKFWHEWRRRAEHCPHCRGTLLVRSVFSDVVASKAIARRVPRPRKEYLDWAESVLPPNPVGVFARNRRTYGRNLPPAFYVKLVEFLESRGHGVVWFGERQSTQPCPVGHVFDFSQAQESRDLERTLAMISQLDFTVQFWTASTRLSGLVGTPFIVFESPEQVYVSYSGLMGGQEGKRLELCSFGPKKVVLAHHRTVCEDHDAALSLVGRAADELAAGNHEDIIGMVADPWFTAKLRDEHYELLL